MWEALEVMLWLVLCVGFWEFRQKQTSDASDIGINHCIIVALSYRTSRRSDLEILKPSSWLILRLQRGFLARPLTSSRDEADAGKLKVTFICTDRRRGSMKLRFLPVIFASCSVSVLWEKLPESSGLGWQRTSCGRPARLPSCLKHWENSGCKL